MANEDPSSRILYTDGPVVQTLLSALQAVETQARAVAETTAKELREVIKEVGEVRIKVASIEAKIDSNAGQGQRLGLLEQQVATLNAVQAQNKWWLGILTAVAGVGVAYIAKGGH
jgi:hypothetical protein